MPTGPGDAALSTDDGGVTAYLDSLATASDAGDVLELVRLALGELGGIIPNTDILPETSGETGLFGANLLATSCETDVFFAADGTDLCTLANADPSLSNYDWEAIGVPSTINALTVLFSNLTDDECVEVSCFFQIRQTLGDDAGPSVPDPGTVALLGIGLLGFGLARRRRNAVS